MHSRCYMPHIAVADSDKYAVALLTRSLCSLSSLWTWCYWMNGKTWTSKKYTRSFALYFRGYVCCIMHIALLGARWTLMLSKSVYSICNVEATNGFSVSVEATEHFKCRYQSDRAHCLPHLTEIAYPRRFFQKYSRTSGTIWSTLWSLQSSLTDRWLKPPQMRSSSSWPGDWRR